MTILFAENFDSVTNNSVRADLVTRRYPGSRYSGDERTGTGFRMLLGASTLGGLTGGNFLQTEMPKPPVGDKYEIIFGFNGIGSTTSGVSSIAAYDIFGISLTAPITGGSTSTVITVQGLDVGLTANTANGSTIHIVLERREDATWTMITVIKRPDSSTIRRKNIIQDFRLSSSIRCTSNGNAAVPATMPTHLNFVAVLADTTPGKMSDISFDTFPLLSSDATGWEFTDTSLDSDVAKLVLDSLSPAIVATDSDAKIMYTGTPDTGTHNTLLIAGTSEEPDAFVKVGSGADAKLLRYNGTNSMQAAGPVVKGQSVELAVLTESRLVTWLDFDRTVDMVAPPITPDRVMPNMWLFSTNSVGVSSTSVINEGPYGSNCLTRASSRAGFLSVRAPDDFLQTGAVIQFWVQPLSSITSWQDAFGIGTSNTNYSFAMRFNYSGGRVNAQVAAGGNSFIDVASIVADTDSWTFVTVRLSRSGENVVAEIWLNDTKSTVLPNFPLGTLPFRLSYLSTSTMSSTATPAPRLGNLYIVQGTELPAPAELPTVSSPWPEL